MTKNANTAPEIEKVPMSLEDKVAAQGKIIVNLTKELDDATKLAEAAVGMIEDDGAALAKEVGAKVEEKTKDAIDDSTAVSDEVKDGIIETMAKIDPDLGADLTEEFAKADMNEEEITGEKFASTLNKVLDKYATRLNIRGGSVRNKPLDKTASKAGKSEFNDGLQDELLKV